MARNLFSALKVFLEFDLASRIGGFEEPQTTLEMYY